MRKDNELIANAIRGLLSDMKKDTFGSSQPSVYLRDKLERLLESTEDEQSSGSIAEPLKLYLPKMRVAPEVPRDDSSEPVTVNQLIGLLESVLESKRSLGVLTTERATEQGGDNTVHGKRSTPQGVLKRRAILTALPVVVSGEAKNNPTGIQRLQRLFSQLAQTGQSSSISPEHRLAITAETSDTYGNSQPWDAATEIDDCPQELYRFSRTGLDARSVEATTPPNSPHAAPSNFITKEELKWLFAEVLGIQSSQPTSDGKDSTSNEKPEEQDNDRPRIRASKAEYKTVNEVYVDESIS